MDLWKRIPWPQRRADDSPNTDTRASIAADTATTARTKIRKQVQERQKEKSRPSPIQVPPVTPASNSPSRSPPSPITAKLDAIRHAHKLATRKAQTDAIAQAKLDKQLTAAVPDRWDPSILPSSPEFTHTLDHFRRLLSSRKKDSSLSSILQSEFSPYERELLVPVDRERNATMAAIQKQNARLYAELLKGERFKGWAARADLVFKLTLMYYGVPVEPVRLNYYQMWGGESASEQEQGMLTDESDVGKWTGIDGESGEGELRFLNGYFARMFEWDGSRSANPALEAFYAFQNLRTSGNSKPVDVISGGSPEPRARSVSLRGGAGRRQSNFIVMGNDSDDGDDPKDPSYEYRFNPTHGLPDATPDLGVTLRSVLDQTGIDVNAEMNTSFPGDGTWIPLYGWQGIVWFPINSVFGFVDAVDRLLGLDNRTGVAYKIYLVDRERKAGAPGWSEALSTVVNCAGVGDFSSDKKGLEWLRETIWAECPYNHGDKDEDAWPYYKAVFITNASSEVNEKPPNTGAIEPEGNNHLLLRLEWADAPDLNRADVAYLRIPEKKPKLWFTNYYGIMVQRAIRLLAPGRIKNRPGRPAIPDAFIDIQRPEQDRKKIGSYGGLCFADWSELFERWKKNSAGDVEARTVTLSATTHVGPKGKVFGLASDRFHIFVPGYDPRSYDGEKYPHYLLHNEISSAVVKKRIVNIIENAIASGFPPTETGQESTAEAIANLAGIEIYVGEKFLLECDDPNLAAPDTVLSLSGSDNKRKQSITELMMCLKKTEAALKDKHLGFMEFPIFLALRPVFGKYLLHRDKGSPEEGIEWDPSSTTLDGFRDLVRSITKPKASKGNFKKKFILVRQTSAEEVSMEAKPTFVIRHDTNESQWWAMRKYIVMPQIIVQAVKEWPPESQKRPIWGHRDVYATKKMYLYPGKKESEWPRFPRHKDFQWEDAEGGLGFKTIQPSEKQETVPREVPRKLKAPKPPPKTTKPATAPRKTPPEMSGGRGPVTPKGRGPVTSRDKELPTPPATDSPTKARPTKNSSTKPAGGPPKKGAARETSHLTAERRAEIDELVANDAQTGRPKGASSGQFDDSFDDQVFDDPEDGLDQEDQEMGGQDDNEAAVQAEHGKDVFGDAEELPDAPPVRPVKLTPMEKAIRLRERSYAHPLSVHDSQNIPVNAPPLEKILSVRGSSMPKVSIGVYTPSDVRQLQKEHYEIRNVNILRTKTCPYDECTFVYSSNKPEAMQQHLRDVHISIGCNFCDDPLFAWWTPEDRYRHFVQKHASYFSDVQTSKKDRDTKPDVIPESRVDASRESAWKFCSRCGRDHSVLNADFDRNQHDSVCYPEIPKLGSFARWTACEDCGDKLPPGDKHDHEQETDDLSKDGPFCSNCALPLGIFSRPYQHKHRAFCKPYGHEEFKFCPWDGKTMSDNLTNAKAHINTCYKKPSTDALGPIDLWESYEAEMDLDDGWSGEEDFRTYEQSEGAQESEENQEHEESQESEVIEVSPSPPPPPPRSTKRNDKAVQPPTKRKGKAVTRDDDESPPPPKRPKKNPVVETKETGAKAATKKTGSKATKPTGAKKSTKVNPTAPPKKTPTETAGVQTRSRARQSANVKKAVSVAAASSSLGRSGGSNYRPVTVDSGSDSRAPYDSDDDWTALVPTQPFPPSAMKRSPASHGEDYTAKAARAVSWLGGDFWGV